MSDVSKKQLRKKKRRAKKRAERRSSKVKATTSSVDQTRQEIEEFEGSRGDSENFDGFEVDEGSYYKGMSIEELETQLKYARERIERAEKRKEMTRRDKKMTGEIMWEESQALTQQNIANEERWQKFKMRSKQIHTRISTLSQKCNSLRRKEQQAFGRSFNAYHSSEHNCRRMAQPYAEKGKKIGEKCQEIREEIRRLEETIAAERELVIQENSPLDEKFYLSAREEYLAAKESDLEATRELREAKETARMIESELQSRVIA